MIAIWFNTLGNCTSPSKSFDWPAREQSFKEDLKPLKRWRFATGKQIGDLWGGLEMYYVFESEHVVVVLWYLLPTYSTHSKSFLSPAQIEEGPKHGQKGPRNATRSREAEKPDTSRETEKPRSREAAKYDTSWEAEKPRSHLTSREAEKPPDKPRSREATGQAEKPRSRGAAGQAEKPLEPPGKPRSRKAEKPPEKPRCREATGQAEKPPDKLRQ